MAGIDRLRKWNSELPPACNICYVEFSGAQSAEAHFSIKSNSNHSKRLENYLEFKDKPDTIGCRICNCKINTIEQLNKHTDSPKHIAKARAKLKIENLMEMYVKCKPAANSILPSSVDDCKNDHVCQSITTASVYSNGHHTSKKGELESSSFSNLKNDNIDELLIASNINNEREHNEFLFKTTGHNSNLQNHDEKCNGEINDFSKEADLINFTDFGDNDADVNGNTSSSKDFDTLKSVFRVTTKTTDVQVLKAKISSSEGLDDNISEPNLLDKSQSDCTKRYTYSEIIGTWSVQQKKNKRDLDELSLQNGYSDSIETLDTVDEDMKVKNREVMGDCIKERSTDSDECSTKFEDSLNLIWDNVLLDTICNGSLHNFT
ncbi:hypothetical protein GJ496_009398 [Pomphorhynchus laevis]|nr:hypothetical protein GJ496_009398 [Pomphorhynchus laevis]